MRGRLSSWTGATLTGIALLVMAPAADARVRWATPGAYRLRTVSLTAFDLDEQGTDTEQRLWLRHRLRLRPTIQAGPATVRMELDVLTGQVLGETNSVGAQFVERRHGDPERESDGWTTVEPRQLWVELEFPWLSVHAGQMGVGWGMGLLDGDGQDDGPGEARWLEHLEDRWSGDLYQRIYVQSRPLAPFRHDQISDLVVAVGADHVYQDEHASFLDDDSAYRLVGSVFFPGEEVFAGLNVTHREQEDRDGDELSLTAFDLHARWQLPLYMLRAELRLQAEAVLLVGETGREQPAGSPNGVDILQLGWAARGEMSWLCPRVAVGVEVGYASGDADPDDGTSKNFTFDPDYRVGLILFSDVMRLITLRGAERMADPRRVGVAPAGAEQLPTDGGVRNAVYLTPGVTWRPGPWRLSLGGLLAWGAERFIDPFASLQAGGTGRNHRGQEASRFYGGEVDAGIHYGLGVSGLGAAEVGIQGGVFVPGAALDADFDDAPVTKVLGRLDLRW
jgi:hypothetical protein